MDAFKFVDEDNIADGDFEEVDEAKKPSGYIPVYKPEGEEDEVSGEAEEQPGDEDFNYTQDIRKMIVNGLFKGGKVPDDLDTVKVVLATLDGMDKQVFGKRRLKQADKSLANDQKVAELLERAQLEAERGGKTLVVAPARTSGAMDKSRLPRPHVLEGEMDETTVEITADQFFEKMESDNPHLRRGEQEN
jgi:hypothetical protein